MKRTSIRSFGIGLFIAGAVLQLQHLTQEDEITSKRSITEEAYEKSQTELKNVKQQLAQLQMDLENAQKGQPVTDESKEEETAKEEATQSDTSNSSTPYTLIVQAGMNSKEISTLLEEAGIVQNKQDFEDYLVSQDLAGRIQIGEYKLDSSMTLKQIAEKLTGK
ncbi:endolytic transglycosylase MltG [Psychrobacillus sp. FJAT-21963]|uniref:endolytic transglycosylase MltG n=1 Tax=Psychrobacillus sp. FJAT-21963 TaxID=1712028 RepID=UPI0006FBF2FB|nr:endolytic transglycosylase MltG [Psychrobacillus sp. FJAT-21963]KQL34236.1 hypothetical protein AN959_14580 [Psychrobacillus sp. FJAT-21963]